MLFSDTKNQHQSGFTIFYAVVVVAVMTSLGSVLTNLLIRESNLTASARESNEAFYAADVGMECGMYWDQQENKFPRDGSGAGETVQCAGFATSTNYCKEDSAGCPYDDSDEGDSGDGGRVYYFTLDSSDGAEVCADVSVEKATSSSSGNQITRIRSVGRDTCRAETRVERALETTY